MHLGVFGIMLVLAVSAVFSLRKNDALSGFLLRHTIQRPTGPETVVYANLSPGNFETVPQNTRAIFSCSAQPLPTGFEWMNPRDFRNDVDRDVLHIYEYADTAYTAEKNTSLSGSIRWPGRTHNFHGRFNTLTAIAPGNVYYVRSRTGTGTFACARHCYRTCPVLPPNCWYSNTVYDPLGCVTSMCGPVLCGVGGSSSSSLSSATSSAQSSAPNLLCGNGVIDTILSGTLEECDDGDTADGDGCFSNCATMMRPYKFEEGSSSSSSAYDAGPRLYFLDTATKTIQSIRPDITGADAARIVLAYGTIDRVGLAIDTTARKMYWLNNSTHKVQRSNLDGTQKEVFASFSGSTSLGSSIAIDIANRYVYWSEYTQEPLVTRILRKEMITGSDTKLTMRITADVVDTLAIENTINYPYIYFSLRNQKKVMKLSYPNVLTTIVTFPPLSTGVPFALDLSSAPKKIYWADTLNRSIYRANIDGTGQENLALSYTPESIISLGVDAVHKNVFFGSKTGLWKTSFTGGIVHNNTFGIEEPAFLQYFNGP